MMTSWQMMPSLSSRKTMLSLAVVSALSLPFAVSADELANLAMEEQAVSPSKNQPKELTPVIIVGEKLGRSHFETTASAEIFDSRAMQADANTQSMKNLLKEVVGVVDLGGGNDLPAIRGVDGSGPAQGAVAFLAGSRPRINLLTDGRSATYNEFAFGTQSLWDMEQMEVFKGPQSLSQGRNAIAGTIVMTSKDPSFEWEGGAKLLLGNQKSRQGALMISGPIIKDELAFRISVDRQTRESYVKLMHYEPVGNPREIETTTARAKLLYMPANMPDFLTRLTINHVDAKTPQNEALSDPAAARYTPERPIFKTKTTSAIWDVEWDLSDQLSFENKVIYTKYRNDREGALHVNGIPANVKGHEWQIEPILRFNAFDYQLRGMVGLFYFTGKQDEYVKLMRQHNYFDDRTKTKAIFGEVTYSPTEKWDLTLGGRFEKETHKRHGGAAAIVRMNVDKSESVFLPKADVAYHFSDNLTTGFKVSRGYNPGGAGVTFDNPFVAYEYESEKVWSYELYNRFRTDDQRLELFTNLFYNQYTDMQLPYYLSQNSVTIRNADKVNTYGAEVTANYRITPEWQVNAGISLLKTDIKSYPNSGVEGKELSRSPKMTLNVGTHYQNGPWDLGANVHWTDKYYSTYVNEDAGKIDSYTQVNLYGGYTFKSAYFDETRISFYADNIFNSKDPIFIPAGERREAITQRPRAFGVSVEMKF